MKTPEDISTDIEQLVQSHYYSEDFELVSAFQAYETGLAPDERELLAAVAFQRLTAEGSMVNILLCSVVHVPPAAPVLAAMLNREMVSNQVTRVLITALKGYSSDEAYMAVERFMDSDQEVEALQALAGIDFVRSLPCLARLMQKEHARGVALHILHERAKAVGLDGLLAELRQSSATRSATFRENLARTLGSKRGAFNPFRPAEVEAIMAAVS